MSDSQMPQEYCEIVSHHLPPEEPVGPDGGRPPINNYTPLRYHRCEAIIHGLAALAMSTINFRVWHNEIQLAR